MPVNWELGGFDINYTAAGFSIDDAYNSITKYFLETGREWLLIIEDDVLLPADCFIRMGQYINDGSIPIVSGLYYTKGIPPEPLIFRGRGNGVYMKWKPGDLVWCDGLPMGCLLIHESILRYMWDNSETYRMANGEQSHKVFETPKRLVFNDDGTIAGRKEGTQDLFFFDQLVEREVLKKTGWTKIARKKYQFLCDTGIFCKHIDRNSGRQFP